MIDKIEANSPREVKDCCGYKHQLLDGFCASRSAVRLCHVYACIAYNCYFLQDELSSVCMMNSSFGYDRCPHCLQYVWPYVQLINNYICTCLYHMNPVGRNGMDVYSVQQESRPFFQAVITQHLNTPATS